MGVRLLASGDAPANDFTEHDLQKIEGVGRVFILKTFEDDISV